MGQALGRSQQVLMEALAEHKAVGVRAVVVRQSGEATRTEIDAARRAAHLLERRGQLKVMHVAVPAGPLGVRLGLDPEPHQW